MTSGHLARFLPLGLLLCLPACPGDETLETGDGGADTGSTTSNTPTPTSITLTDTATATATATATVTATATTTSDTDDSATTEDTAGSSDSSAGDTEGTSGTGEDGSSGSDGSSSGTTTGTPTDPCDGAEVLLYDQPSGGGMVTGAPAGMDDAEFIRSADDFEVAEADQCWCVTRVVLHGEFFDSMLSGDLEVGLHEDAGGLPTNPPVAVESGAPIDMNGQFDFTFETPVVLSPGTHWLAAMPTIPDVDAGIWFWLPTTGAVGTPWAMEADFGPFVPDCEDWTSGTTCFDLTAGTDLAFEIHGVIGGDNCM